MVGISALLPLVFGTILNLRNTFQTKLDFHTRFTRLRRISIRTPRAILKGSRLLAEVGVRTHLRGLEFYLSR